MQQEPIPYKQAYQQVKVEDALKKVKKHVGLVLKHLEKKYSKPIHKIPWFTVVLAAYEVLGRHPSFTPQEVNFPVYGSTTEKEIRTRVYPHDKDGKSLYSHYEIGHQLIMARVISELKAEKTLDGSHENLYRKVLGELYENPPTRMYETRLKSLNKLVKKLGEEKVEKLLKKTIELWANHSWNDVRKTVGGDVLEKKNTLRRDTFANPALYSPIRVFPSEKPALEEYRERLKKKSSASNYESEEYY